jgi:hypothetical protein
MGFYRTINPSQLRQADIIVSTTRSFISGAIRVSTGTDFSHAMLYIGGNRIIEAIDKGVVERSFGEALRDGSLAVAIRRRGMDRLSKTLVVETAKSFKGLPYDHAGAVGSGLSHRRGKAVCALRVRSCLLVYVAAKRNAMV